MQKVTLTACCILFTAFLYAQQVFFVYMQSEGRQPFYAKLNGRVLSSTASGYLVIPRLTAGDYTLLVGFPKSDQPELNFPCRVENNDLGFSLKKFGDKGWGLFNLRNFTVIMPATAGAAKQGQGSQYSDLLAQVVKDPSVKDVTVEKPASKPPGDTSAVVQSKIQPVSEPAKPVVADTPQGKPVMIAEPPVSAPVNRTDTFAGDQPVSQPAKLIITDTPRTQPLAAPEKPAGPPIQSQVTRLLSMAGKEGTDAVYVVTTGAVSDTIRIYIPDLKAPVTPAPKQEPANISGTVMQPVPVKEPVQPKQEPAVITEPVQIKQPPAVEGKQPPAKPDEGKFLNFEAQKPPVTPLGADTLGVVKTQPDSAARPASKLIMYNTGCAKIAGEEDFIKLRKNMAGERTDDEMVTAARKAFKQRCYLLKHIRALSALLTTDEGRYQLFDAAYAYTYDTEEYGSLVTLLTDPYYINRFRAMIRKQ